MIYVVALVVERRSIAAIARPAAILVVLMIALTFYSQNVCYQPVGWLAA